MPIHKGKRITKGLGKVHMPGHRHRPRSTLPLSNTSPSSPPNFHPSRAQPTFQVGPKDANTSDTNSQPYFTLAEAHQKWGTGPYEIERILACFLQQGGLPLLNEAFQELVDSDGPNEQTIRSVLGQLKPKLNTASIKIKYFKVRCEIGGRQDSYQHILYILENVRDRLPGDLACGNAQEQAQEPRSLDHQQLRAEFSLDGEKYSGTADEAYLFVAGINSMHDAFFDSLTGLPDPTIALSLTDE
jgi:hypothetical protein